ncbi:MAG: PQQ-binding-like beta-propeller repeat protein, partial [bacterium]|nr:PQQ-binding-like beta-propeller repeat protein [bacterium]
MRQSPVDESRPARFLLWALAAVGLVTIASLVVIYFAGRESGGATAEVSSAPTSAVADPVATADRFLAAWSSSDWATIRELLDTQESRADEALAAWWSDLDVLSVRFSTGSAETQGDSASVPFDQIVEIHGAGDWAFSSTIHLALRRGEWKVSWSPGVIHPALKEGDRLGLASEWPQRALITDMDGRALVKPVAAVVVGLIPERIVSRDETAAALEETLSVARTRIDSVLDAPGVQPDWFLPVATISREDNVDVRPALYRVPGIAFRLVDSRAPVDADLAAGLLGTTGEVTAEQLDALGDRYTAGLIVGRTGLEESFERQLAGTPTVQIVRQAEGGDVEVLFAFPATAPSNLRTTLSSDVQLAAESALADVDLPASIVAVHSASGEIRAVASTTTDGFRGATSGLHPPGSTFKIVVAAALLENGLEPTDPVSCPKVVTIAGREFGNAADLAPTMSFEQAFAQSCNTAFIQLAADLGPGIIAATAARFGFGGEIEIGIAAADASFPTSTDSVQQASAAIGQGEVLASPLNMASVAATAATGTWHPPTLTTRAVTGVSLPEPLDAAVVDNLRSLMRAVVVSGTGRQAAVEDREMSGKTGTAQINTPEGEGTIAWFVGFSDDLAFAVQVDGGTSGGSIAAPIAAAFIEGIEALPRSKFLPECVATGADWVTFQGDMTRSGCSQAEAILEPRKLWQADVGISGWLNSPIVVDDLVIVGSAGLRRSGPDDRDGVYALDLHNGRQVWYFPTDNDVNGVVAGGGIIIATGDEGSVWGIDINTGAQVWSFSAGNPVFTNPLVVGDVVFVGDASGVLWALGLDGSERWSARLDGAIRGGAASDGQMVYAVSEQGEAA